MKDQEFKQPVSLETAVKQIKQAKEAIEKEKAKPSIDSLRGELHRLELLFKLDSLVIQ